MNPVTTNTCTCPACNTAKPVVCFPLLSRTVRSTLCAKCRVEAKVAAKAAR